MDIKEFLALLSAYKDKLVFEEVIDDESFRTIVKCGDAVVLDHVVIKCKCETADEIRNYVYGSVAEALYLLGISHVIEKCGC